MAALMEDNDKVFHGPDSLVIEAAKKVTAAQAMKGWCLERNWRAVRSGGGNISPPEGSGAEDRDRQANLALWQIVEDGIDKVCRVKFQRDLIERMITHIHWQGNKDLSNFKPTPPGEQVPPWVQCLYSSLGMDIQRHVQQLYAVVFMAVGDAARKG